MVVMMVVVLRGENEGRVVVVVVEVMVVEVVERSEIETVSLLQEFLCGSLSHLVPDIQTSGQMH